MFLPPSTQREQVPVQRRLLCHKRLMQPQSAVLSYCRQARAGAWVVQEILNHWHRPRRATGDAKPLKGFHGAGVLEVVEDHDGNTYRAV